MCPDVPFVMKYSHMFWRKVKIDRAVRGSIAIVNSLALVQCVESSFGGFDRVHQDAVLTVDCSAFHEFPATSNQYVTPADSEVWQNNTDEVDR